MVNNFRKFCATIVLAHFECRTEFRSKVFWLSWYPLFSFSSWLSTFLHQRDWNVEVRLHVGTSWPSTCLMSCVGVFLKYGILMSVCVNTRISLGWKNIIGFMGELGSVGMGSGVTICLSKSMGCFGIFSVTPFANNSAECSLVPPLEASARYKGL